MVRVPNLFIHGSSQKMCTFLKWSFQSRQSCYYFDNIHFDVWLKPNPNCFHISIVPSEQCKIHVEQHSIFITLDQLACCRPSLPNRGKPNHLRIILANDHSNLGNFSSHSLDPDAVFSRSRLSQSVRDGLIIIIFSSSERSVVSSTTTLTAAVQLLDGRNIASVACCDPSYTS